jgi:hypothetical protein
MSSIKAGNGRITLEHPSTDTFVGSTADGSYPPAGIRYKHFDCKPSEKTGILVFSDTRMLGGTQNPYYNFYQFVTDENGKIFVDHRIKAWTNPFQHTSELGIMVVGQKWTYVTTLPDIANANFVLVDILEMLKYVEGKITLDQLRRGALRRIVMEAKQKSLEARLADTVRDLTRLGIEHERLVDLYAGDQRTIKDLRYFKTIATVVAQVIKRRAFSSNPKRAQDGILCRILNSLFFIRGLPDWKFTEEIDYLSRMYCPDKPGLTEYPDLT